MQSSCSKHSQPITSDKAYRRDSSELGLEPIESFLDELDSIVQISDHTLNPLDSMLALALRYTDWDFAAIARMDAKFEQASILSFVSASGPHSTSTYDVLGTPCQSVLACDEIVLFRDVQQRFADEKMLQEMNIQEYIGMRFYVAGHAVGHLFMMRHHISEPAGLRFAKVLLRVLAMYVGTHLDVQHKDQLIESLSRQAHTDSLTGLRNRNAFDHDMQRIMQQVGNDIIDNALLVLLDIDGLKPINDTLGHASGDALIQQVAEILKHDSRQEDLLYRLGGDEFAILITGNAQPALGRLPSRIRTWRKSLANSYFSQSGVSVGAAMLKEATVQSLDKATNNWFEIADKRLYADKLNKEQRSEVKQSYAWKTTKPDATRVLN